MKNAKHTKIAVKPNAAAKMAISKTPPTKAESTTSRTITAVVAKLPEGRAASEKRPSPGMNAIESETDRMWKRNLAARKRLGLRLDQDVRTAKRPTGMAQRRFDALCGEVDETTRGFFERLAGLWGHSLSKLNNADGALIPGKPSRQQASKAEQTKAAKRAGTAVGARA